VIPRNLFGVVHRDRPTLEHTLLPRADPGHTPFRAIDRQSVAGPENVWVIDAQHEPGISNGAGIPIRLLPRDQSGFPVTLDIDQVVVFLPCFVTARFAIGYDNIGFIAVIIAITAAVIYELGVVAWSILLVGLFVPFAFGMYWKKSNEWGGVAAFLGGFISWAIFIVIAYNSGLGGDSTMVVCAGDTDCAFWDATYIASFPAFFVAIVLMIVVSLATQKQDKPKPITDIDGNPMDTNPFHGLGILPLRDAIRKLKPEELEKE